MMAFQQSFSDPPIAYRLMPFWFITYYKQSGWGREMGHDVLLHYTEVKSVCVKL